MIDMPNLFENEYQITSMLIEDNIISMISNDPKNSNSFC